jgi:multiple sugar transport system substrate-binding protein
MELKMKKGELLLAIVITCSLIFGVLAGCRKEENEDTVIVLFENTLNPNIGDGRAIVDNIEKIIVENPNAYNALEKTRYEHTKYVVNAMEEKGYKVTYEDWGWGEPLRRKQTTAMSVGYGTADVFIGEAQMVDFAYNNYLLPFPDNLADYVRQNCYPGAYKSMEIDGKIYGVANSAVPSALLVNKTIADKVYPDGYTAPETWADWLQQMQDVKDWASTQTGTERNIKPGGPSFAENSPGSALRYYNFMQQTGSSLYDKETKKPTFDTQNVADALKLYRDIKTVNVTMSTEDSALLNDFVNDKLMFIIDGIGMETSLPIIYNKEIYVVPYPKPAAYMVDTNLLIATSFYGVPAYESEKRQPMAFEYIKTILEDGAQLPIRDLGFKCTPLRKIVDEEFLASKSARYTMMYDIMKDENLRTLPNFPYDNTTAWSYVGRAVKEATITSNDLSDIMKAAQTSLMIMYDNYK